MVCPVLIFPLHLSFSQGNGGQPPFLSLAVGVSFTLSSPHSLSPHIWIKLSQWPISCVRVLPLCPAAIPTDPHRSPRKTIPSFFGDELSSDGN